MAPTCVVMLRYWPMVLNTSATPGTCSTLSMFSHPPSRNPSFSVYNGGESNPYSHKSLEIGDSVTVENL